MPRDKQDEFVPTADYRQPLIGPDGDDGDEMDFFPFWTLLWEGKWLVLAVLAFCILAGEVYYFIATPSYKADALIQVEEETKTLAAGLDELSSMRDAGPSTSAEIEILQSRMVLGKVVESLRLDRQAVPKYFPVVGAPIARRHKSAEYAISEPWFNLPSYAWGGEKIAVETLTVPDHLLGASLTLVAGEEGKFVLLDPEQMVLLHGETGKRARRDMGGSQSIQLFVSMLKARPGTRFVLRRTSPHTAMRDLESNFTVKEKGGSGVLELTLAGNDPIAVGNTLNAIANIYLRQNVERRSEEAEKRLEFLEKQLPSMKEKLDASERAYNAHRKKEGSVDLEMETQSLLEQLVNLESALRTLELKRDELRQKFTPSHPRMIALDGEIAQTRASVDALNAQTTKLPDTQFELLRLERDVKVDTELYTTLLNSLQELRVAKAGTLGSVRIIDHAVPPLEAESPQQGLVRTLSLIGGLFLGIAFVLVRNVIRTTVDDPDRAEKILGLPVYASIPHSEEQSRYFRKLRIWRDKRRPTPDTPMLVAQEARNAVVVEGFRSLRTALHFAMLNARSNSIVIAGPRPQVGKSFVLANLGVVFAQSGKRVLLIDADMRLGHLHRYFGMTPALGLSDYISKDIETDGLIHPTVVEGLDLIPVGTFPPNPSELLMHERFAALLKQTEDRYDLVLIDSPPVLAATDAVIMGQLAGATLLVVKSGLHPMRELRDTAKRLRHSGVNLRGVIFNDVPLAARGYGYGSGKYAYHYSYKERRPGS